MADWQSPYDSHLERNAANYEPLSPLGFLARTAAVAPAFRPDEADLGTVLEVCRRLDGLPLVIELAAARLRALSLP